MEDKRMKTMYKRVLIAVIAQILTTGLALAKPKTNKAVDVTLTAVTTMPDGAQLQPGDYRMTLLSDSSAPQVAFCRQGKLVCKCPVKLENNSAKAAVTQLLFGVTASGAHVLQTVTVKGWTQLLIFSTPAAPGAGL
jgi:hypothetical protein